MNYNDYFTYHQKCSLAVRIFILSANNPVIRP